MSQTTNPPPPIAAGLSVNTQSTAPPLTSPLPSPSFSLAPQRQHSFRQMTTPTTTPNPTTHASTNDSSRGDHRSNDRERGGGYSLRGGRSDRRGGLLGDGDRERESDRDRDRERPHRSSVERDTRDYTDRPSHRDRETRPTSGREGGRMGHESKSSSYRRDALENPSGASGHRADAKKLTPNQIYANSLPVVGLLETPPSPELPPAFSQGHGDAHTAEPNPFSVLDDSGEREDVVEEDLPFDSFPLSHTWQLFYDKKTSAGKGKTPVAPPKVGPSADPLSTYESNLHTVAQFKTVHEFWSIQNHLLQPSQLEQNSTLHMFKDGIKPVWEDENNSEGGKWIFRITTKDKPLLDHFWQNTLLAVIGNTLDDSPDQNELCGVVLSRRKMGDRIAIWNRSRDNTEALIALGHRFRAALIDGLTEFQPNIVLNYEDNKETIERGYCAYGSNVRFTLQ